MPGLVTYTFGPFAFDPSTRRLSYGDDGVRLERGSASVLVYFLQHPNEVVSRDALLTSAWEDTAVSINSLDKAVSLLRRALDDLAGCGSYVETHTGEGYRFTPQVQRHFVPVGDEELDALLAPHRAAVHGRAQLDTLDLPAVRQARQELEALVRLVPEDADVHTDLAEADALIFEDSTMDLEPDVKTLEHGFLHAGIACRLEPDSAGPVSVLAHLHVLRGDTEAAMAAARRAESLDPKNPRHKLRVGRAGWGQVRLDAGEDVLEILPSLALGHWLCGTVYIARDVAKKAFDEVVRGCAAQKKQTPGAAFNTVGLYLLHALLLARWGRLEDAMEALECEIRYVKHSTLIFARECLANCYYTLAAFQWRMGLQDKWRQSLAQSLIVAPGHVAARAVLHGEVRMNAGKINAAMGQGLVLKRAGQEADAARVIHDAVRVAPAGAAAWISPVEPWLNAAGRPEAWAELLALIRVRAT